MAWTERTSPSTTFAERTPTSSTEYYVEYGLWVSNYYPWLEASLPWQREYLGTVWTEDGSFILSEDSTFLLLEDGGQILNEQQLETDWSERTEPSTSWT